MDSKEEVEKANDEKINQDFPGYPHYPAKEDIMDQRTDSHRVDLDVENLPNSRNLTGVSQRFDTEISQERKAGNRTPKDNTDDDLEMRPGTEADVTEDDLAILNSTNDEIGTPQNVSNEDLNVTGHVSARNEENLQRATLDHTDLDGDELNEDSFGEVLTGADLDIPEEGDDTTSDALGQGDEENKYFSLGGDRHENLEEDPYSGPERDNS